MFQYISMCIASLNQQIYSHNQLVKRFQLLQMSFIELSYLFSSIFKIAVWLPQRVGVLLISIVNVNSFILNAILSSLTKIDYFQHFLFLVSVIIAVNQMQLPWMEHWRDACIFYLLRQIQLVRLISYVSHNFPEFSILHAQQFTVTAS